MAAAPAGAQTVGTLVSNVDEGGIGSPRNYAAQSFRTGGQAGGYEITEIRIFGARSANPPTEPLLKIRDDDGGEPGDLVATLSNPSHFNTDEAIFRAPSGTMLDANTTYWVMINDGVTGMRINYSLTSGNGQTGQPGWSIGDTHLRRLSEVNEWATDDSDSVRVHIRGPVTAAPIESGADATLRNLRVRTFTDFYSLRPDFDPGTTSYLVSVPYDVRTLYVAPTPSDSGASVRVSPGSRFNSELWEVSVSGGSNTVNVIVTAVDGTEKRYRLNLLARNPTLTHDARLPPGSRLRFLALSAAAEVTELPGEEIEGEDCGCATYYQVVVPRDVSRLQVAAMAQGGARVETQFRRERRMSDAVRRVSLREGRNELIVFVYRTGNNPGRALEVYRVMIIRAGPPPKLKDATVTRDGHVLLHYDRTLHPSGPGTPGPTSTPGSAFEVTVDGVEVEVTYTAVTQRWLRLNLARGAGPDAQVRVRYRVPSTNPVQTSNYGRAEAFSNKVARYAGSGLTVFDTTAQEAPGATADFKVMLLPAPVARVTVDYATSDGTATAGADYTATSGTLTFGVGEEHKTISVPVADDDFEDGGETFTLTLSNPVNAFLGDAIATGTITNDDPALLTGSFVGAPETHGSKPFDLELEFTEPVGVGWEALRDEVLSVTNGRVTRASRVDKTRDPLTNQWLTAYWQITVEPSGGDVTVELPATADCGARLAVCTSDGRPLSAGVVVTVAEGVLPPELVTATVNADAVTLTWDEALDEASVPGAAAFTVRVGGVARELAASGPVTVSGSTVTLTLASPVGHGETVTVDYTAPSASPLRNLAGGAAAALDGQPVTNRTPDTTGPALVAAAASWDAVVLTWDEALDEASVPGAAAFTVRVGGAAWELAESDPVTVSGSTVTLRFGSPVAPGETVTVDYAAPAVDPLQDLAGVAAAAATVETVVPETKLTVRFEEGSVPAHHDGVTPVEFRLAFSEELAYDYSYLTLRNETLVMFLGERRIHARRAFKLDPPSRKRWQVEVALRSGDAHLAGEDLSVRIDRTRDCADPGAVCTGDGRRLSNGISAVIGAAPSLSVDDTKATEAAGGTMDFTVTLSRAASETVTVDYATSDETATAGADYTAASGTLTFAPGETEQTVSVPVLDDGEAEGPETLALTLSNASGGFVDEASATGTIWDDEPPADGDPLTAELRDLPASHDGSTAFTFDLRFSEEVPGLNYRTLRDHAFTVTDGEVTRARRLDPDGDEPNREWEITVEPDSDADVSISLHATTDCQDAGAICVGNRPLSAGVTATVPGPEPALTASFSSMPASHDGSTAFTFELRFSEDWTSGLSHVTLRDHAFTVANGAVTEVRRLESGRNQRWEITVEPAGDADVTVELPATTDCGDAGAICIGTRPLSAGDSATVAGPAPLTAEFRRFSVTAHDGSTAFTFELRFSEDVTGLSYRTLRDHAFAVTNGAVTGAGRLESGKNRRWEIAVEPAGDADVTVELPATTDCGDAGAICIGTRPLSAGDSATVAGRLRLSVADATVTEAAGASVDFAVRLDRPASAAVTVDYATSNGTATAGADYTSTSGTLTFAAGEVSKTIAVPVLEDSVNEGSETFTMTLSNPSGGNAYLFDAEATGTIENHDPLPRALMARFGRAAAVHVVEQVEERLAAPREPGFDGRFAGRELRPGMERDLALEFLSQLGGGGGVSSGAAGVRGPMTPPAGAAASLGMPGAVGGVAGPVAAGGPPGAAGPGAPGGLDAGVGAGGEPYGLLGMGLGGGDVLTGSAFALSRETRGGVLSFWSRGAWSSFAGEEGDIGLDGDVRTTMFGADYARGPLVVGLSLANSRGLGEYVGVDVGQVTSSVTGLYPWLGYRATERVTVWGVAGYGTGALVLTPGVGGALESGLSMAMAATGTRGELIASGAGGFGLAFKADALRVGTAIEGVEGPAGRLAATAAAVSRLRTGLEGSRDFTFAGRLSLTPSVEVGLRHDGGDAETGAGMDVGGGLAVSDPSTGLTVDVRVRTLVVHEAEGFRERGVAVSLGYDPTPSTPLGFEARVAPSWGGQATGGAEALWGRETMAGLTHGGFASGDRLDAEVGYGLPVGSRLVGTPRFAVGTSGHGRDYRLGYSLGLSGGGGVAFRLGVEAHRREAPHAGDADNGFVGRATLGW